MRQCPVSLSLGKIAKNKITSVGSYNSKKVVLVFGKTHVHRWSNDKGSSFNFARVRVEVTADRELVDEITFEDPYGNCHIQKVLLTGLKIK